MARALVMERLQSGEHPALCADWKELDDLTAKKVGDFAKAGEELAQEILYMAGTQLGRGLSILIDLLNPQVIVIGGVFTRCRDWLWPAAQAVISRETLPQAWEAWRVVPSRLSESVGDIAALSVAWYYGTPCGKIEENAGNGDKRRDQSGRSYIFWAASPMAAAARGDRAGTGNS